MFTRTKTILVVAGATLLTCPISLLSYYGNLLPYLTSYFYATRQSTTHHLSVLWPTTTYCICVSLSMVLTRPIEKILGIKKSIICVQIFISICILSGYYAIEEPVVWTLVFGVFHGSFVGASHYLIHKFLLDSVASMKYLATSAMSIGPAFGSLVNIFLAQYVINPKNITADLLVQGALHFSDPDIIRRVPYYFIASGIFTAVSTTLGTILLIIGGAVENNERKQGDKEFIISNGHAKKNLNHWDSTNNLIENCKTTYGGCDSAFSNDKEMYAYETLNGHSIRDESNYSKSGEKVSSNKLKNTFVKQENLVGNKSTIINSKDTTKQATSINTLHSFLHHSSNEIDKNDSYLDKEKASHLQDQYNETYNVDIDLSGKNVENSEQINENNGYIDKAFPYENASSTSLNGSCFEQETSGSKSNPLLTLTCDLSPWETLRTKRFWCIWFINLFMSHTYYIQTNLYKQYGQAIISSDMVFTVTGLLCNVAMAIARPSLKALSDKYGASSLLVMVCFVSSLFNSLMVVGAYTSAAVYLVATVIDFASVSCLATVLELIVASNFGKSHCASNMALVNTTMVAVIMKPIMVSMINKNFGWDWVFLSGSLTSALALLIAVIL